MSRVLVRRGARRAAVAVLLLAAACGAPPPIPERSFPLVELADSARAVVETDAIDIGAPESRSALWSGWGPNESSPEGSFVWGAGERSLLRFDVVEPRDRRLRVRGWSFPFGDAPVQEVRFSIGGRELARRKLASVPGTVEIELPKEALAVGENFLELRYARHADGATPWAAGWDAAKLDGPRAGAAPRIERGSGKIVLPARTALEWTLELTGGSWLAWKSVVATGDARLAISIVSENDRREESPEGRSGQIRLTSDGSSYRLHTIALRALGASGEIRLTGLRLHAPDLDAAAAARAAAATAVAAAAESSAGTAPAGTSTAGTTDSTASAAPPPSLILYIVDTLRADHLGCYGYRKPTSPSIDAFARTRAVRFQEARAQTSWTRPAVATLLTGLHPTTHGAQQTDERLSDRFDTLAERLSAAGWQTAMITTNGNVGGKFGMSQGFDEFRYLAERRRRPELHVRSREVHRQALEWLDARDPARPFLLVLHSTDPHDPYTPAPKFRKKLAPDVADARLGTRPSMDRLSKLAPAEATALRQDLIALYDGEIAENDASFGELLAELDRRGLDRTTAILLTADHGEEFFEHGGWTHGATLYEEQLRIPMLLALPDRQGAGSTVSEPVEQIDVAPTFLALAGMETPKELPGSSLLDTFDRSAGRPPVRTSYAWLDRHGVVLASAVRSEWKLIENRAPRDPRVSPPFELYSLGSDPDERNELGRRQALRRNWLLGQLQRGRALFGSLQPSERSEIDPELRATLHALGYL